MSKLKPSCIPITFIPTKLRRPDKSGKYLAITEYSFTTVSYSKKHDIFNAHDDDTPEEANSYAIKTIAWAHFNPLHDYLAERYKEVDHE